MRKLRIAIAICLVLIFGVTLYKQIIPGEYKPDDNEIALHIQLDTKEDIGLLVYEYSADDEEYSGGVSNADRSLMKHDSDLVVVWNKQELNSSSDAVQLSMNFGITTEYVEPNYDNIYPDNITRYVETPVSWNAQFGGEYFITITGDKTKGYKAVLG